MEDSKLIDFIMDKDKRPNDRLLAIEELRKRRPEPKLVLNKGKKSPLYD